MREKKPPMPARIKDACEIEVQDNNIEKAWRILRRRTEQAGVLKQLKIRRWHLTTKARRRAKKVKALKQAVRLNKLITRDNE